MSPISNKHSYPFSILASAILALLTNFASLPAKSMPQKMINTKATFYSNKFNGKKTASGHCFSQAKMTAASNTIPLGSQVLVKNKKSNKQTKVTINDRGAAGRSVDLSKAAARKIGLKDGIAPVKVKILKTGGGKLASNIPKYQH